MSQAIQNLSGLFGRMMSHTNICVKGFLKYRSIGSYALLFILIIGALFSPTITLAQSWAETGNPPEVAEAQPCDWYPSTWFTMKCMLYAANGFAGMIVWALGTIISFVGRIFSIFAAFALSGAMYDQLAIEEAWTVVRDVSNIGFIFILLYVGIATILDIASHDTTKLLARVIIAALLINFSLAIAKVPIDAGNIFAISFYNAIGAEPLPEIPGLKTAMAPADVSGKLMNALSPQRLFKSSTVPPVTETNIEEILLSVWIAQFFQIVALLMLLYVFLTGVVIFLTRIVWLWLLLIFSPAAFIAYGANMSSLWKLWTQKLVNYSIVAPIYMFFLYFAVKLGSSEFTSIAFQGQFEQTFSATGSAVDTQLSTWASSNAMFVVAYCLIIGVLQGGAKVAKKLGVAGADAFDKAYKQTVGMAKTAVVGVATGGAGLVAGAAMSAGGYAASSASALTVKPIRRGADKALNYVHEVAKTGSESPDTGRLSRRAAGLVMRGTKAAMKGTEEDLAIRQKRFAEEKDINVLKLKAAAAVSAAERFAAFREIAKRGDMSDYGTFKMKDFENDVAKFRNTGANMKDLEKANPLIAGYGFKDDERKQKIFAAARKNPPSEEFIRNMSNKDIAAQHDDVVSMYMGAMMNGDVKAQRAITDHAAPEAVRARNVAFDNFEKIADAENIVGSRLEKVVGALTQGKFNLQINAQGAPQNPIARQYFTEKVVGNRGNQKIIKSPVLDDIRTSIDPSQGTWVRSTDDQQYYDDYNRAAGVQQDENTPPPDDGSATT